MYSEVIHSLTWASKAFALHTLIPLYHRIQAPFSTYLGLFSFTLLLALTLPILASSLCAVGIGSLVLGKALLEKYRGEREWFPYRKVQIVASELGVGTSAYEWLGHISKFLLWREREGRHSSYLRSSSLGCFYSSLYYSWIREGNSHESPRGEFAMAACYVSSAALLRVCAFHLAWFIQWVTQKALEPCHFGSCRAFVPG